MLFTTQLYSPSKANHLRPTSGSTRMKWLACSILSVCLSLAPAILTPTNSGCQDPGAPPDPAADIEVYLQYLRELSDYTRCKLEKNQGQPYPGICADLDRLDLSVDRSLARLILLRSPVPFDGLKYQDLTGVAESVADAAYEAEMAFAKTPPDRARAWACLDWMRRTIGPDGTGIDRPTFRSLAGCD